MDPATRVHTAEMFFHDNKELLIALSDKKNRGIDHIVIDYSKVMHYDIELAQDLLEEPEEVLKAFEIAADIQAPGLPKDFRVRFKNLTKSIKFQIHEIRDKFFDKFIMVTGTIKQKSDIRPWIVSSRFECPSCGNIMNILQLDEKKLKTPSGCGCGRKQGFKQIAQETINVYSMQIEEPIDEADGSIRLSKIKLLCKNDLCSKNVERNLYPGVKIEVTGTLKQLPVLENGVVTTHLDWFIDVNYVKIFEESYGKLKISADEEVEIKKFAEDKDPISKISKTMFSDVSGFEEEKRGLIVQMFGGVGVHDSVKVVRGDIHVLLIGDGGLSKSTMLKRVKSFVPKGVYAAGSGVTGAGIIGAVVKDELTGGFCLEAGAFSLANNGQLFIDELDKIGDEFKKALHQPMEDQVISINKAGISQTLPARAAVLAAANPKYSSFSSYDSIYEQFDMEPTLISRFDLVYPFRRDRLKPGQFKLISDSIMRRGGVKTPEELEQEKKTIQFIRKYVSYARQINPTTPQLIIDYISDWFESVCVRNLSSTQNKAPVTPRTVEAVRRISQAIARSKLHTEVTYDDLKEAIHVIMYSLEQIALDPNTNDVIPDFEFVGANTKRDLLTCIRVVFREAKHSQNHLVSFEELIAKIKEKGFNDRQNLEIELEEFIKKMLHQGDIMEPRTGFYQDNG